MPLMLALLLPNRSFYLDFLMLSDRNKRRKDKPNEANYVFKISHFFILSY